jgi:aspartate-semialdehyde dehydrogenase
VGPALVPPLAGSDDLDGVDTILVASDGWSSRHEHLLAHLDANPDVALVDLSRLDQLWDRTHPSVGRADEESRQLRVAHPALIATSRVVEVLAPFGALRGSLAAVDPVSVLGREAIELLASQARQRMIGAPVEDRILGHILAFNLVATDNGALQKESAVLLPDVPLAVSHTYAGCFHGNFAHLGLSLPRPLTLTDVVDALSQADGVKNSDYPLGLDTVPDRDELLVGPPALSADGVQLALTLMVDGLRIGGALTAIDILDSLL